jgi:hypothetical protein
MTTAEETMHWKDDGTKRRAGGMITAALGILLALGGCTDSHVGRVDADEDGHVEGVDCNDADPSIYPGADESCCDGVDSDCDGADSPVDVICNCLPTDADGDGYPVGEDCNDADATVHPGASDPGPGPCGEPGGNGRDDDCDGLIDEGAGAWRPAGDAAEAPAIACIDHDMDGYDWSIDCDDEDPAVHPGAPGVCGDDKDNNCNGLVDEDDVDECFINGMLDDEDFSRPA